MKKILKNLVVAYNQMGLMKGAFLTLSPSIIWTTWAGDDHDPCIVVITNNILWFKIVLLFGLLASSWWGCLIRRKLHQRRVVRIMIWPSIFYCCIRFYALEPGVVRIFRFLICQLFIYLFFFLHKVKHGSQSFLFLDI